MNRYLKSALLALFVLTLLLPASISWGQDEKAPLNSRKVIEEARKLYAGERYQACAELCLSVTENDSNYYEALTNLISGYLAYKQDSLAIIYARKGLAGNSALESTFYNLLGISLIGMEKNEEAMVVFKEAILKYPYVSLLYYNLAVCQRNLKHPDDAIASLEKSISLNPYHARSHLKLGVIFLEQNKLVPGILATEMYLIIDPDSKSAKDMVLMLEKIVRGENELDLTKGALTASTGVDDFSDVEDIIRSKIALNKRYKSKTKLTYDLVKQVQVLLEKLTYNKNDKGFVSQYYVPFFTQLFSNGYFEPFVYYSMGSVATDDMKKWSRKKKSKIDAFTDWATLTINAKRARIEASEHGEQKSYSVWHYDDHSIQAIGNENENKKAIGPWKVFTENGVLEAQGTYDQDGNKTGQWNWYYDNGGIKETASFKTGLRDGMTKLYARSGDLSSEMTYLADKEEGDYTSFYSSGNPEIKLHFTNGKKQGPGAYFFANGAKQYEMTYLDNELSGPFKGYYNSGETEFTCTYAAGKKTGDYIEYFRNGAIKCKGLDQENNPSGKWSYYFNNGNLEKEGEFTASGNATGPWKFYYRNGKLSEEKNFDEHGDLNGKLNSFDSYGRPNFEQEYKNGSFIAYRDFDKTGKVTTEGKLKDKKLIADYRYINGNKQAEGKFENSKKTGAWKYYSATGKLSKTEALADDVLNGLTTTRYATDTLESSTNFSNGLKDGAFHSWYANGKTSWAGWYKNDNQTGDWYYYDEKGNLVTHNYFENGQNTGWQYFFYPNGKPKSADYYQDEILRKSVSYDSTGKTKYTIELKNGTGDFNTLYPNNSPRASRKFKNGSAEGTYTLFFPTGKKELEGTLVMGKETGKWTCYYEDGSLRYTETYENGALQGPCKKYFKNGNLEYDGNFNEGKQDGKVITYYENKQREQESFWQDGSSEGTILSYSEDGGGVLESVRNFEEDELLSYSYTDKNGTMAPNILIQNGTGNLTAWYPNGNKSVEKQYLDGEVTGLLTEYFVSGKIRERGNYTNGIRNGLFQRYYPGGQLKTEEHYYYGKRDGTCTYYAENGKPERIENYYLDDKHGKTVVFDKTGTILNTQTYFYGILYGEN